MASIGLGLVGTVAAGCTQHAKVPPEQMSRIEAAANKAEAAANQAQASADKAKASAAAAQAAADKLGSEYHPGSK
jgi:hypothetical protein